MEKIKKTIKSKLSKFREEEKGDAMAILMFIGLKHYSLLYPDQPYVQMSYLKFLTEKYLMEAENPEQRSNFMRRQQLLIEANERKYRPDFMAHFPFADEYGSIGDVLSGAGTFPEVDLDNMGAPGRNRLIVKVFEEMRLDQRGIRISDLPEALDRLSIHVSPKLRRTLLKARGKDVNGPLLPSNLSNREGEPWEYMEKHVPLSLWKAIVKNFLRLRRQGIQPGHLQDVLPTMIPGRTGQRAPELSDDDDNDNDEGDEDDENYENGGKFGPYEEDKHDDDISTDISYPDERRGQSSRATQRGEQRHEQRAQPSSTRASHTKHHRGSDHHQSHHMTRATISSQQKQHKVDPIKAQSRAYYSRLQRIPSRLGHVIREHRFHHHQQQVKHDRDALHTIGSRRVDILTAQAPKLGFADPAYHHQTGGTNQRDGSLQRHGLLHHDNPANQTTKLSLQAKSVAQQRLQRGAVRRLHQLDSGAATLEIADAFLQSNVGRELMLNSSRGAQYRDYYGEEDNEEEDDDDDADLSPKEAQARAAALLGLSSTTTASNRTTATTTREMQSRRGVTSASSSSTAQGTAAAAAAATMNNTSTSSRLQEKVDHVAATKALYEGQSGWKATKGGWVADFGPAHTHPLYAGPDHYTPFLLDRKQDRELARSSHNNNVTTTDTELAHGGSQRNGKYGHKTTSENKKIHRLDEADVLFATSRPSTSGTSQSGSRHLSRHRHFNADAAEDDEFMNIDGDEELGHGNDVLFLSEVAPTVISPKPSANRSDRKVTHTMQVDVESSPVSSDDAALYTNATVGRSGVLDDSLDGAHDDNSEDDVDALMSRLQSSISLKDIASDNE